MILGENAIADFPDLKMKMHLLKICFGESSRFAQFGKNVIMYHYVK